MRSLAKRQIRPGFSMVKRDDLLRLERYEQEALSEGFTCSHQSPLGTVVVLGRLFYRRELLDHLGAAKRRDLSCANDAALVMAAYERWGCDAFAHLEGDFSLALYDARERSILALRDPLGGQPLYYTASPTAIGVSTFLGPLLSLVPQLAISGDGLADYLLLKTYGFHQPSTAASMFEGIARVRVGELVRIALNDGTVDSTEYWRWAGAVADMEVHEQRADDIHERFAGLLREAVRERCTEATAAHLSGGMDSTSVALLASEHAASSRPLHTISLVYEKWHGLSRETPFLEGALQTNPRFAAHRLRADDLHDFGWFPDPPATDEPWPGLYHAVSEDAMCEEAAVAGASSMLTGAGGDEVACLMPFDVADRLREGHPWSAWRAASAWAAGKDCNVWQVLWPYGLVPTLPAALRGGLTTFLRGGHARWSDLSTFGIPPWVDREFARRHDLHERAMSCLAQARRLDPSLQVADSLDMILSRNGDMVRWYLAAPRGIHAGNPFLDPRVVLYGLAARSRTADRDREKSLLADAMREVLPREIRERRRKGNFNEAYFMGLSQYAEHLEAMIEHVPVDDLGFLDKAELQRCFREYRMAKARNLRASGRMTVTLAILNWLSHHRSRLHSVAPARETLCWMAE